MEGAFDYKTLAYVIGVAIGDGNLSNPNGRCLRLRVTCDTRYPHLIKHISQSIQSILPDNKVSIVKRAITYVDISCYSNRWEQWLPWTNLRGPKSKQVIHIPSWIMRKKIFSLACLRGLIETDGCIYIDRGYVMVNFTTVNEALAHDVDFLMNVLDFEPKMYLVNSIHMPRYTLRLARDTQRFIELAEIDKS